ncbi:MAG TPA: acyltransferase [Candidatus Angelobacter sp.]|nr:acyltransferase [Candidatus Angelobacter sp.]
MLSLSRKNTAESLIVSGNTEWTRPENRAFYPALDGVRALAFLMVFGEHYLGIPWGWAGVDVFFVLSGFLITGILFDTRNDTHRVRNFYVRRTLRIFPLYYGTLLVILLLKPFVHWQINWHWLVWPAYLGNFARFIQPYSLYDPIQMLADFQPTGLVGPHTVKLYLGHFWSLCVEEQFYLFWPWIVFWLRDRKQLLRLCIAMFPLCLGLRLLGEHVFPDWMLNNEILYRLTPFRLDALLLGGFFALVIRGQEKEQCLRLVRKLFPVAVAIVALWMIFRPHVHIWQRPYVYPDWKFTWGLSAIDLLSAMLILMTLQPGNFLYRLFNLRPLRWMGRISYGAYVLHDIPHLLYFSFSNKVAHYVYAGSRLSDHAIVQRAEALTAVIALGGTLFLAWLSFRWFESPFLNLKERWASRVAVE